MSKTITIDDDVYELLSSLKQGAGDSFTKGTCKGLTQGFIASPRSIAWPYGPNVSEC
jgi:hypothetical protein